VRVFNRAVVILETLLLIVTLIVAAVVPNTVLDRLLYTAQQAQSTLQLDWPRSYFVFLLVAIVLIFLLLVLLWLELRPQSRKTITVRGRDGTEAEVSTSSVAQSLQRRISEVPDVSRVRATVRGVRAGVDVVLDLETAPEIDIPSKMDEVSQAARDLVESKMGLHVARIKVNIKQVRYGEATTLPTTPSVQPGMPAPPMPESDSSLEETEGLPGSETTPPSAGSETYSEF
jgi:uncharacterized alkaline shock family protein YloU